MAEGSRINLENNDDDNFEQAYGNDFETNRRYLSLSWWLLHKGCIDLIDNVRLAVKDVFGSLNPREEITLEKLSELTLEVRKRIEGATEEERRYILRHITLTRVSANHQQNVQMALLPPSATRPRRLRPP